MRYVIFLALGLAFFAAYEVHSSAVREVVSGYELLREIAEDATMSPEDRAIVDSFPHHHYQASRRADRAFWAMGIVALAFAGGVGYFTRREERDEEARDVG
ncbi:hypothetical protein [Alkalisalibacterium limincola]|uniref:Uncharacterized protein n=1 Tax=Alkalisalibacterium limincola TaxID=2699169 RepID=A0A5C8KHQ4_9GAMM|nr:hypothetical protein [Alkalisalibacterium limincola]TXK59047.1 hypothetical protein FU658_14180 [Alkalisalibacterium limincola]